MDDTALKLGFCEPTAGRRPEAANELILDTKTMKMLGAKQEIGAPVTLELNIRGQKVTRDFVISGWWEPDPVFNVSMLITSRAYTEAHAEELVNSYYEDYSMTGVINSYVMFSNSFGLEEKLDRIITESGYSTDDNAPN